MLLGLIVGCIFGPDTDEQSGASVESCRDSVCESVAIATGKQTCTLEVSRKASDFVEGELPVRLTAASTGGKTRGRLVNMLQLKLWEIHFAPILKPL